MEAKAEGPLNNNEIDIPTAKVEPPSNTEGIIPAAVSNKSTQKDDIMSSVSSMYNNAKDSVSNYSATESVNNMATTASIDNAKEAITEMLSVNENIFYLNLFIYFLHL
jgi:hypothetical protein